LHERKNLFFKFWDSIQILLCTSNKKRKKKLFELGFSMLNNELDIATYLKTIRKVEFLSKVLLTKA
jgi:hypothetical protein